VRFYALKIQNSQPLPDEKSGQAVTKGQEEVKPVI